MSEDLISALANLQEEEALRITTKRLDAGDDPLKLLEDSRRAMEIVGKRFANGEYFIPELVYSGEILKEISEIVGLSGFLTLAFDSMKQTVEAIKAAGLRDRVKIMIGGGQIDEQIKKYTGADACGTNAMAAVSLAKEWAGC